MGSFKPYRLRAEENRNMEPNNANHRIVQFATERTPFEALNEDGAFFFLKRCSPNGHLKLISALDLIDQLALSKFDYDH